MTKHNLKTKKTPDANNVLSGRCYSCKFWENPTYNRKEEDVGRCSKLSGTHRKDTNTQDVYPELENTGIESVPISWHDGGGFDYETKSWFGCIHYNARYQGYTRHNINKLKEL